MTLHDALFNWLQIKIVSDSRQDDRAAKETLDFFDQILREDHHVTDVQVAEQNDTTIQVEVEVEGKRQRYTFDRESAEQLLSDINTNPKYNA